MSRFSFAALLLSFLLALPCAARAGDDAATVVVDAGKTLRRTSRELLGINVNYFMGADGNRRPGARRLARAVLDLGVGTL
ncbi:MAG TPA: alpha-L-arabinofuranosidase, partial [Desulfovibrio sp.]|nr:alpha-L-arabinofuranosidase [Desulfovibrio sp.]